jgi:hypothetical protein
MPLLLLLAPAFRYSRSRDAYVLRAVGNTRGPVLRCERRRRLIAPFEGADRRGAVPAAAMREEPPDAVEKRARRRRTRGRDRSLDRRGASREQPHAHEVGMEVAPAVKALAGDVRAARVEADAAGAGGRLSDPGGSP